MLAFSELQQIVIDTSSEMEKYKVLIKTMPTQRSNSHRIDTHKHTNHHLYN